MYKMKKEERNKVGGWEWRRKKLEKQARYKLIDFWHTIWPILYEKSTRKTTTDMNLTEIRGARVFLKGTY